VEINKRIGLWNNDESSYLDDVAYKLYVNYYFKKYNSNAMGTQVEFNKAYNLNYGNVIVNKYYDIAKLVLRREKIERILSRGNK